MTDRRRVVLHVGLHKTGSSAIQEAFRGYDRDGFVYPDLGPVNHSYAIRTAFDPPGVRYAMHDAQGRSDARVARLRRRYRPLVERALAGPAPTLILSGEDISGIEEAGLRDLVARIEAAGRDILVVVYLREPVAFSSALVIEALKHGQRPATAPRPPYYVKLKRFMDVVGPERMVVRDYRPESFPGGDVVADFAEVIGAVAPLSGARVNVSLSAEACNVLAALIDSDLLPPRGPRRYAIHRAIHPLLDGFGSTRFRLPVERVEDDLLWGACQWLRTTFGIDYACAGRQPWRQVDRSIVFAPPDLGALAAHLGSGVTPETALSVLVARARRERHGDLARRALRHMSRRLAAWRN